MKQQYVSFNSSITVKGASSPELSVDDEQALLSATVDALEVQEQDVVLVSTTTIPSTKIADETLTPSEIMARGQSFLHESSRSGINQLSVLYDIRAIFKTSISMVSYPNEEAEQVYRRLVETLSVAVVSGNYTKKLNDILQDNSTLQGASVEEVVSSGVTISNPPVRRSSSSANNGLGDVAVSGIVLGSAFLVLALCVAGRFVLQEYKKTKSGSSKKNNKGGLDSILVSGRAGFYEDDDAEYKGEYDSDEEPPNPGDINDDVSDIILQEKSQLDEDVMRELVKSMDLLDEYPEHEDLNSLKLTYENAEAGLTKRLSIENMRMASEKGAKGRTLRVSNQAKSNPLTAARGGLFASKNRSILDKLKRDNNEDYHSVAPAPPPARRGIMRLSSTDSEQNSHLSSVSRDGSKRWSDKFNSPLSFRDIFRSPTMRSSRDSHDGTSTRKLNFEKSNPVRERKNKMASLAVDDDADRHALVRSETALPPARHRSPDHTRITAADTFDENDDTETEAEADEVPFSVRKRRTTANNPFNRSSHTSRHNNNDNENRQKLVQENTFRPHHSALAAQRHSPAGRGTGAGVGRKAGGGRGNHFETAVDSDNRQQQYLADRFGYGTDTTEAGSTGTHQV